MENFKDIINRDKPVLVDFFATWCGPCRMQGPILDRLRADLGDRVEVVKVDIDKEEDLAAEYHVRSVPTLILFVNGRTVWRTTGLQQLDVLTDKILQTT